MMKVHVTRNTEKLEFQQFSCFLTTTKSAFTEWLNTLYLQTLQP